MTAIRRAPTGVNDLPAPRARVPKAAAARAWQRMLSGRRLDLLDPSPLDIEIEDIAHGLARVARWNGQTVGDHAFSVAQHSIVVETIAGQLRPDLAPQWRLAALLHDASEYVIGDMISPFKAALGVSYRAFESRLEHAIHLRFGLPATAPEEIHALIKQADRISAGLEAVRLAGFQPREAAKLFGSPSKAVAVDIEPLAAPAAQAAYLARFARLFDPANHPTSPAA